jgi:hypothetical protein
MPLTPTFNYTYVTDTHNNIVIKLFDLIFNLIWFNLILVKKPSPSLGYKFHLGKDPYSFGSQF